MTEIADSLLAKVRALLAKAEGTDSPAEAEAFTAKASELMAKYGIERAMLADLDPTTDEIGAHDRIHMDAPYARDKATLLSHVAMALGCKSIVHTGRNGIAVTIFGFASDRERAEMLFTSLLVQAAHALAVEQVPYGESIAAYRRSWYSGYAIAVYRRVKAAEDAAKASADTTSPPATGRSAALVLADRGAQVESAYENQFGNLKKSNRRLSGSGQRAGYQAGQRADLGGKRVSTDGRRAVG